MEIAPGIHRIESSLGVRFMAQYLLVGEARRLLVDTGLEDTPAAALRPYLASIGLELEAIDDVVISHADLDHSGGNRALRALHPRARFACHELDRRWIESNHALVAENAVEDRDQQRAEDHDSGELADAARDVAFDGCQHDRHEPDHDEDPEPAMILPQ